MNPDLFAPVPLVVPQHLADGLRRIAVELDVDPRAYLVACICIGEGMLEKQPVSVRIKFARKKEVLDALRD